ncbi:phenylacetate--CoA ligase family protein [Aquimarina sp. 2201CG14-23]|uniref:phenylacetate--CoA ligase family protein n=1 Tax=Aquimarina mycalae TaxID=3040073 RepID=UPI00247821FF|nr:hypothetical protein [Aquimarina sp. 2201CG14-23]MDH7446572.1 hypothetical protein [Aquimarina sp. 2201CG14-23]
MGGIKEKIYGLVPYPLKFILLNIKGYMNVKERFNKDFYKYYNTFKGQWDAKIDVLEDYQEDRLRGLLIEVYEYSDWYQTVMKDIGITASDIDNDPYAVLKRMPILKKIERRTEFERILNKSRETAMVGHTSGTSGTPMIDHVDLASINISFAFWKRFHYAIGLGPKNRQVRLSGKLIVDPITKKPPFWMYNYFDDQLLMSTYHLTENNLGAYIKKLNRFKPVLIDGYPSALYIMSKYINKHSLKLNFVPKAIAVTAETLYDYQREEIEKAFQCNVYNQYASNEGSPFITECVEGNLHLNIDSGVFEFFNTDGKKAVPGDIAKLVVTSFINYRTPLIRYDIGDTVMLNDESSAACNCGCEMPIIERIIGREDDILWTEEKGYVGRMDTAFKGLTGIKKSQIIQENPKEIVLNMVIDEDYNDSVELTLLKNLKERLGEETEYQINIIEDIPVGANGKFDAVKRNFELEF